MRPKSLVLLILALGCGLVASIGISQIIDTNDGPESDVPTEAILVAKVDIERSSDLSEQNVEIEDWPVDKIPEGVVRDLSEVEGRRPVIRITKGLPILQHMLGIGQRAALEIPKGFRVVAVSVGQESGAGLIRPGDRVDVQVYATRNPGIGINRTGIWTFLQDVSVFAVNSTIRTDVDSDGPMPAQTVSLLVTPSQASKVTLASELGNIRLVMRGASDDEAAENTEADPHEIFGGESEKFVGGSESINDAVENAKSSMFEWLQDQKKTMEDSLAAQQQALAAAQPALPGALPEPGLGQPIEQPWRMVVMTGTDVRIEEFEPGALLPTVRAATGYSPSPETPAAPDKEYEWPDDDAGEPEETESSDEATDETPPKSDTQNVTDKLKDLLFN